MLDRPINFSIYLLAKLTEALNGAVFKLVRWRDKDDDLLNEEEEFFPTFGCDEDDYEPEYEPIKLDAADDPDSTQITLREFDLGDLQIECPQCREMDHLVGVGLGISQHDDDDNREETWDLSTVGMVAYTCGCIVYSGCLTDKVASILNLSDSHLLTIDMLAGITRCDEHGVLHSEE